MGIDYVYDFADHWVRQRTITDVGSGDANVSYPRYIGGEQTVRRRIAAAYPAFTERTTRRPIPNSRIMQRQLVDGSRSHKKAGSGKGTAPNNSTRPSLVLSRKIP